MKIEQTYIADDGKRFDDKNKCMKYESELRKKKQNEILQEIKDLDLEIWKKYYPDYKEDNEPELYQAPIWLRNDIVAIIIDFHESENDIISIINRAKHGKEIIADYLKLDLIRNEVMIRTDFLLALCSVEYGSDLSSSIQYSLSSKDLFELAKLHKANKCRKKIEELLTSCNFHYECGKFANKEYGEFLRQS